MSQDLVEEFQGNSDGSPATEVHDGAEALNEFRSIEGDFIDRHHTEPRVHFCVPKEEKIPIPLKYMDVTRTTHTSLEVLQEKRINDFRTGQTCFRIALSGWAPGGNELIHQPGHFRSSPVHELHRSYRTKQRLT